MSTSPQRNRRPSEPDLRVASLVLKEGFKALATHPLIRPEQLTPSELEALSTSARADYNRRRRAYHANYGPIKTPMLTEASNTINMVYESGLDKRGDKVRESVIISAPPGLGKTTLVVDCAQRIFNDRRAELGDYIASEDAEHIPVVYISMPSNPTPRAIDEAICRFFAAPLSGNESTLLGRAQDHALSCRSVLIVLDEVQFIDASTPNGRHSINHLKSLTNYLPVTFVFVGTGLFNPDAPYAEDRVHELVSQMARRWTPVGFNGFQLKTETQQQQWRDTLLTLERDLVLARKHPGMLADDLANYLFARSSGHMNSLMSLITRGSRKAITTGEEKLTEELLSTVAIDAEAERQRASYLAQLDAGAIGAKRARSPRREPRVPKVA